MHWKHDRVQVRGANRSGSNSISEQNQWSVQSTLWETRCARVSGRASAGCAERKQFALQQPKRLFRQAPQLEDRGILLRNTVANSSHFFSLQIKSEKKVKRAKPYSLTVFLGQSLFALFSKVTVFLEQLF